MISIIGAGPIGSYLAYLLAKNGEEVKVFEEHLAVGQPVQCTGIVSSAFSDIIELKREFFVNKIGRARVYAPNKSFVEVNLSKPDIVIDRGKFDIYLAKKAKKAGAEVFLGHRFIGYDRNRDRIVILNKRNNSKKYVKSDVLVGADGANSSVRNIINPAAKVNYYIGAQARIKGEFEKDVFKTYFGSICPYFFGWVVPESNEVARVGIAVKTSTHDYFSKFLDFLNLDGSSIIDRQGGLIPVYNRRLKTTLKLKDTTIYIVGDAATMLKATTGGGIVPGLIAAECLADCIVNHKSYDKEWRKRIARTLYSNLLLRKIGNKFSDEDYNYMVKLLNKEKVQKTFSEYRSKEFSPMFFVKLLSREPRFMYYITKTL